MTFNTKKIFLLFILLTSFLFSQSPSKFEFTSDAMNHFIVTDIPDKSAPDIYQSAVAWIKKNYNSPDDVLITTVENDYIRFQGVKNDLVKAIALGIVNSDTLKYTVEISFKDNKYKFEIIKLEKATDNFGDHLSNISNSSSNVENARVRKYWDDVTKYWLSSDQIEKYKKNGSGYIKKDGTIRSQWKNYIHLVPDYFNQLNDDLKNYINGNSSQNNKDW